MKKYYKIYAYTSSKIKPQLPIINLSVYHFHINNSNYQLISSILMIGFTASRAMSWCISIAGDSSFRQA